MVAGTHPDTNRPHGRRRCTDRHVFMRSALVAVCRMRVVWEHAVGLGIGKTGARHNVARATCSWVAFSYSLTRA